MATKFKVFRTNIKIILSLTQQALLLSLASLKLELMLPKKFSESILTKFGKSILFSDPILREKHTIAKLSQKSKLKLQLMAEMVMISDKHEEDEIKQNLENKSCLSI